MPQDSSQSQNAKARSLLLSERATRLRRVGSFLGRTFLFLITSASAIAVLFIFAFIIKDALPFFFPAEDGGTTFSVARFTEFFTTREWYPSREPPSFGALSILYGSAIVTLGAIVVAVPLGISAAVCLSDVLPFGVRQMVKPVIEILAAIPSVAFGFFALVVFAPYLQQHGGAILTVAVWLVGVPVVGVAALVVGDIVARRLPASYRGIGQTMAVIATILLGCLLLWRASASLLEMHVSSGTNAFNVSIILGIMALPTVVSVAEDALQAAGRELREGSYALGATRVETIFRVIIPAAAGGICAAVILGVMRAVGETMVVWMASGNAAQIPHPFYNLLEPVRTLTATIAGDMGEADQTTGSARYHVLFAMALCLLTFSFLANLVTEWITRRARAKLR